MKYSIFGFNQQAVIEHSKDIDTDDLLILDYVINALASPTMKHITENEISYVWLQHAKMRDDLPILNISEDRLKRRLKKLSELNLIVSKQIFNERVRGSRTYYSITEQCETLRFEGTRVENNTCSEEHVLKTTLDNDKNEGTRVENNTSDNRLISNTDNILKKDKIYVQNFLDLYTKHCVSLPKLRTVTDKRKRGILNIVKKFSYDDIITVFKKAEESDFLKGKNNTGWKADIDFILREDKFVNILEGKYDNKHSIREASDSLSQFSNSQTDVRKEQLRRAIQNGTAEKF